MDATGCAPDISVIMPVRNGRAYVTSALRSVLDQAGPVLEVVVVDDGSTDGTAEVVAAIGDPRVRVVPGPGRGVAEAMNTGLANARGRYIARCDADDFYPPGRLVAQLAFLEAHPEYGAVCGRFETADASGRPILIVSPATDEARELTQDLLDGQVGVHLCSYLVRREPMLATGGFRSYFRTSSDIDFQMRLCEQTRIWYEPQTWYRYRLHDDSITHRHSKPLQRFFEAQARRFQVQRAVRSGPAGPGVDDLDLGVPPDPPEHGVASPDRSSAREEVWHMRWGEAWRRHAQGQYTAALLLGARATLERPWRVRCWRGMAALAIKAPARPPAPPAAVQG